MRGKCRETPRTLSYKSEIHVHKFRGFGRGWTFSIYPFLVSGYFKSTLSCRTSQLISEFVSSVQIDSDYIGEPPAVEVTILNVNDNIDKTFLSDLVSYLCKTMKAIWNISTNYLWVGEEVRTVWRIANLLSSENQQTFRTGQSRFRIGKKRQTLRRKIESNVSHGETTSSLSRFFWYDRISGIVLLRWLVSSHSFISVAIYLQGWNVRSSTIYWPRKRNKKWKSKWRKRSSNPKKSKSKRLPLLQHLHRWPHRQ